MEFSLRNIGFALLTLFIVLNYGLILQGLSEKLVQGLVVDMVFDGISHILILLKIMLSAAQLHMVLCFTSLRYFVCRVV